MNGLIMDEYDVLIPTCVHVLYIDMANNMYNGVVQYVRMEIMMVIYMESYLQNVILYIE
jgi:hypothetical protein